MTKAQYFESGEMLTSLRKAKGWFQQEFAVRAGVTQQTVSRWEKGVSRPRSKELASLAALLEVELSALERAAGYSSTTGGGGRPAGAPTYDIPLPLQSLRPDSFENFCADLLERHYRNRAGVVNRFGGTGSKQHGIDIEVRGEAFGVHSFQCKRVEEFGEQKVHAAVAAHQYPSDLQVLLLSNIASPKARMAIAKHSAWQLWDQMDLSARFRELPMVDRRDLVDVYFRGRRRDLLGEPEAGPFQKPEEFFRGLVEPGRYFTHGWDLVGRQDELKRLRESIMDDNILVTMLLGAPGNGKTRLLRELVEQVREGCSGLSIFFVSPTEDVKAQHLDELGVGAKLLVVDDAHDREDIAQLMRYASVQENRAKLLLALRPYGRVTVRNQASLFAMDSPQVATIELSPRSKQDATELATQVLLAIGGPLEAADGIAKLTFQTPLVTVLAAQIVARENMPLALIGNSENFQEHILARLEKIISGQIVTGQDVPKLQAVLRAVALLQPVVVDDPGFLNILRDVEGLEEDEARRLLRLLSEGGVLFKRGLRFRLAPDLLADAIIQNNFISSTGAVTQKVEQIFDLAETEYLKHLLVNLGRLDWRLRNGETAGSTLLSRIAGKLRWQERYNNPHVQAVEAVAYYQPRLALRFAEQLIDQGHGDDSSVCGMVRNAAFNLDFLEDACLLLWRAGRGDARDLNPHPSHGIRILKQLAEFEPGKPIECVERVVAFAIELLDRPASLYGIYSPFNILEGALRTDMEDVSSTSRQITIQRYQLNYEIAKGVRARVIDAVVDSLHSQDLRRAFLAAGLLAEVLRGPWNGEQEWDAEPAAVLERVCQVLQSHVVHPVIKVRAAISVGWHAFYNSNPVCNSLARTIISCTEQDLPTRLVRLFADAWGHQTWKDDDLVGREVFSAATQKFIEDLSREYLEAEHLYEFLTTWLKEVTEIATPSWGQPHLFINQLLQQRVDLARMVVHQASDAQALMTRFAGAALAVLIKDHEFRDHLASLLSDPDVHSWELVAEAYARQAPDFFTDEDLPALRSIFQSREPMVLHHAASIARLIATKDPAFAVELICLADLSVSAGSTHDFFMWLSHDSTVPVSTITDDQWCALLGNLSQIPDLEDYWVQSFLRRAIQVVPADVLEMLKSRLQSDVRSFRYWTLRRDQEGNGLALLSHPQGRQLLRSFLAWAVEVDEEQMLSVGSYVAGLCGKYGGEVLALLLELMRGGKEAHVNVVAAVLRSAQQELVIQETPFVREALNLAELIGASAVRSISSALWAATFSGGRSGIAGEPFKEDLEIREHAEKILCGLSRLDPAHKFYSGLLQTARDNIEWQARDRFDLDEDAI